MNFVESTGVPFVEQIGLPAALEGCAEECVELAHVCLKMARNLRKENPTPIPLEEIRDNLAEEIADVIFMVDALVDNAVVNEEEIDKVYRYKESRCRERIKKKLNQE